MTDLAPLHRRLRRALDLSSLLMLGALAPACASTQDQDTTGKTEATKTEVTKTETTKPDPTKLEPIKTTAPQVDPEPPEPSPDPDMYLPRCPTVDWCGSRTLIEAMRPTDITALPPAVEGCLSMIQRKEKLDPKLLAGQEPPPPDTTDIASIDAEATKAKRAAGDATSCCYEWTIPCPGGRPLLIDGHPWLASLRAGHAWSTPLPASPISPTLPDHVRERIAEGWLRDGLSEHASIASFDRARAELDAIEAPPELLRACEQAAKDEVEHTCLCFSLAKRFSGRGFEPTALPKVAPRGGDALAVALDTFVEGCIGETIAAACARRAASLATDPVIQEVLDEIAYDETEHAALAWRTIAWIIKREGPHVLAAILEVARELYPRPAATPPVDPDAALLLAYGRLDDRTLAQTRALAWRDLIEPLLAELGATTPIGLRPSQAWPS